MEQFDIIYAHDAFAEQDKKFHEKYDLKHIFLADEPGHSKRDVGKHIPRTCLFCNRTENPVKFDDDAHLVSKFIGNASLYSHFECDECNRGFSDVESHLSSWLGIARTLNNFHVKKKAPGFVGRKLRAKSRSFIGEDILIFAPEDHNREGNKITIRSFKNAYAPCKVYRALLKSALSLLGPEKVRVDYPMALDYLNGKFDVKTGVFLGGYKFRVQFPLHVYWFQKKNRADKIPTDILAFYFMENSFTLPLPFHQEDLAFMSKGDMVPLPPPFFINQSDLAASEPTTFGRDFSSAEPVRDDEEILTFVLDSEDLKDTWYYDPANDVEVKADFNPGPTKFLVLTRSGFSVNPKEFSAFIRKLEEDL